MSWYESKRLLDLVRSVCSSLLSTGQANSSPQSLDPRKHPFPPASSLPCCIRAALHHSIRLFQLSTGLVFLGSRPCFLWATSLPKIIEAAREVQQPVRVVQLDTNDVNVECVD